MWQLDAQIAVSARDLSAGCAVGALTKMLMLRPTVRAAHMVSVEISIRIFATLIRLHVPRIARVKASTLGSAPAATSSSYLWPQTAQLVTMGIFSAPRDFAYLQSHIAQTSVFVKAASLPTVLAAAILIKN